MVVFIGDVVAELSLHSGIVHRYRTIYRGMPVDIRCVVCERAQGKCIPVDIVGILQHGNFESTADLVRQVIEVFIAERIIAEVLDDAPAIRVGVRVIELILRCLNKSLFQKRLDLV